MCIMTTENRESFLKNDNPWQWVIAHMKDFVHIWVLAICFLTSGEDKYTLLSCNVFSLNLASSFCWYFEQFLTTFHVWNLSCCLTGYQFASLHSHLKMSRLLKQEQIIFAAIWYLVEFSLWSRRESFFPLIYCQSNISTLATITSPPW